MIFICLFCKYFDNHPDEPFCRPNRDNVSVLFMVTFRPTHRRIQMEGQRHFSILCEVTENRYCCATSGSQHKIIISININHHYKSTKESVQYNLRTVTVSKMNSNF